MEMVIPVFLDTNGQDDEGKEEDSASRRTGPDLLSINSSSENILESLQQPTVMDFKQQRGRTRASYFCNVKNRPSRPPTRLGTRLPAGITQPPGFVAELWDASGAGRNPLGGLEEDRAGRHHIRNPKLRQYYLKEAAFSSDLTAANTPESGSVSSRSKEQWRPSATSTPSDPAWDPDAMTPTTPVSPATDSEYDKLLDVEAVPLPDGQLCLLALPSEVTQGAGPADLPYLKLFCRFITDRKGVVSGILLVTANKIFFDPSKSHPLVQENGCEEYLFSCSVDNLSSVAFFCDISHVHFSKATQRWKGRKKPWKAKKTQDLTEEIQNRTVSAKTDARDGDEEGGVGGESQDVAEMEKQLERLVLEAAVGAESGKETERQSCLKKEISDPGMTAHGGAGSLMFVRLRQKVTSYTKRKGFSSLDLGKSKPAPTRDTWFALQQENSDELYAYLSQQRPDLCILEEGEGEVEGERDEEDFVLLDDAEEEEELSRDGHAGDEWEMVCVEESRSRNTHPVDKEPDCLSDVLKQSVILDAEHVRELSSELPARTVGHAWKLAYSTDKHGASLKTLYRKLSRSDSPVLLLIRDHNQQVFGAFLSEPLRLSEVFYGTGETFLFLLHPRFKCFRWTGENSFFIKGDLDSFAIGGGSGHFGLWLDEALYLGRSSPCYTFNNCSLSESSDFRVLELEAWTFW